MSFAIDVVGRVPNVPRRPGTATSPIADLAHPGNRAGMITLYGTAVARAGLPHDAEALRRAVWTDLLEPSSEEVGAVERVLGLEIPTREEMQEIEASSRLHREGDALFLTASFLHGAEVGEYGSTAVTFVLTPANLVTVRYATPRAFPAFAARCARAPALLASPDAAMLHLFEQVVDRLADVLERGSAPTWTAPARPPSAAPAPGSRRAPRTVISGRC